MLRQNLLALFVATAVASPLAAPAATTAKTTTVSFCPNVVSIVNKASAQSVATAFCSSYLSIKTVTLTSTTTPTVIVPTTTTITTSVSTVVEVVLTTSTTTTTVSVSPVCSVGGAIKRATAAAAKPAPKPSCFSSYTVSSVLSSACTCLSIPTPSTSTTTTAPAVTQTSTATVNVLGTTTVTSTSVVAEVATATVVGRSPPFRLQESGGSQNGKYGLRYYVPGVPGNDYTITFQDTSFQATGSYDFIGADCNIEAANTNARGAILYAASGSEVLLVDVTDNTQVVPAGYFKPSCKSDPSGVVVCNGPNGVLVNNLCNFGGRSDVWFLDYSAIAGCSQFTVIAKTSP